MPEIRMRTKHQVTLPASVVRAANLHPDDRLMVTYVNGNIIITPKKTEPQTDDVMQFAGIGRGLWGNTPEAVIETIRNMRSEWER